MPPTDKNVFETECMTMKSRQKLANEMLARNDIECKAFPFMVTTVMQNTGNIMKNTDTLDGICTEVSRVHQRLDGLAKDIPKTTVELTRKRLRITNLTTHGVRVLIVSINLAILLRVFGTPIGRIMERVINDWLGEPTTMSSVVDNHYYVNKK